MPTPHRTLLFAVVALAANSAAQTGWVQRQPATTPPVRGYHAMTFDVVRNKTVMFGGFAFGGSLAVLNDTWEWDGSNWTQRLTPHAPPPRRDHALAADIARGRVVLFGGNSSGDSNDTWEYDGNDWTQILPASQPSARQGLRMAYDAARARTVLFGGAVGPFMTSVQGDTWEWDGANWTQRTPVTSPSGRYSHGMVYDFARSRIVLFGGTTGPINTSPVSDTWTWDGTDWTQLLLAGPPGDPGFGLSNDPGRDVVTWFGGTSTSAQTWLFDHGAWRPDPRAPNPAQRNWCPLAHDLLRGRTVLFGGSLGLSFLNDTWEYDPGAIARWTPSGSGCAGTAGVPMLRPVGGSLPIVGSTFRLELLGVPGNGAAISIGFSNQTWNGNPLPFDLGAFGMTGCTLHAGPDVLFFAPVVAGRATLSWSLPNAPSLTGVRFFNQGFVLDPGINPTGATVSNAGVGTIGPF